MTASIMMKDLNYFPLDVESNIYGMTTLNFDDRPSKILVATSDCRIYCINYNKFNSHTREVEFTYIPNGAKIISIGALKRATNDYVIGITHSLAPSTQKSSARLSTSYQSRDTGDYVRLTTYYFNIYASGSGSSDFDLDYVAQGCQTIRLRFVPYHLYQTESVSLVVDASGLIGFKRKPYWLLSGGDNCIHAYCEERPFQSFTETPIEDCFPELAKIPGLALWIDVLNIGGVSQASFERAIALGFEDGSVRLYHSVLSSTTNGFRLVKESAFDTYTTIIPSVRLFKVKSTFLSMLKSELNKNVDKCSKSPQTEELNLLATSSTEPSIIFQDVLNLGLNKSYQLPQSQRLDCVVTSTISDVNFDGLNEIILGTHGRELMTYQYDVTSDSYYLSDVIELNHPIFAISVLDLTGDAVKELAILLTSGILVMQASVKDVIELCRRRVDVLLPLMESITRA